ncbi:hypothetical protein V493_06536 [Pseudogymnoascus sp. VKM F-4281 (FW-2241)]|nr:hypothetical protein V493_06536 [Pseudogymnoascus sp. VKM F-4281 (FW-2241)]
MPRSPSTSTTFWLRGQQSRGEGRDGPGSLTTKPPAREDDVQRDANGNGKARSFPGSPLLLLDMTRDKYIAPPLAHFDAWP